MNTVPLILAGLAVAWIALAVKVKRQCAGHDMEPMPNARPTLVDGGPIRVRRNTGLSACSEDKLIVEKYTVLGCQNGDCLHTETEWRHVATYSEQSAPDWVIRAAIPDS